MEGDIPAIYIPGGKDSCTKKKVGTKLVGGKGSHKEETDRRLHFKTRQDKTQGDRPTCGGSGAAEPP